MSVQQDSILDIDSPRKIRPGRSMFGNMSSTKIAGGFVLLVLTALAAMYFLHSTPAPMYVCGAGLKDLNGEYDFGGVSEGASFYGRATSHGNEHYVSPFSTADIHVAHFALTYAWLYTVCIALPHQERIRQGTGESMGEWIHAR